MLNSSSQNRSAKSAASARTREDFTPTPDRRYFVVRGRLWRLSNPGLEAEAHEKLVRELMSGRRDIHAATTSKERVSARIRVDAAKRALGERGDVWWNDGSPDYNRKLAVNTPYASWFTQSSPTAEDPGSL
jgi:hypothetical protein